MVRNRRTQNPTGRSTVRKQMKALSRSFQNQPKRANIPSDPPAVIRTYTYNTIMPMTVMYVASGASQFIPTTISTPALIKCALEATSKKSVTSCPITGLQLLSNWRQYLAWSTDSTVLTAISNEIAIRKVAYWGPSTPTTTGVEIGLQIKNPPPYSDLALRDVGTTIARPRCCVTLPFQYWASPPSGDKEARVIVSPDVSGTLLSMFPSSKPADGTIIGMVHVTVSVRAQITV